jgi:putative ABC transport system permease protein
MLLARRNLFQDKTRLGLSVGGVALAVMLILLLNGFLAGMNQQITSYLDKSPGSIVVAQKGVRNLLGATSLLPGGAEEKVKKVEGVNGVIPILSQFVILDLHGKKQPAYMIGYDPERGGGPWEIASGREPQTDREVVLDLVLAKRHKLQIGDGFELLGQEFTVVGLSEDTTSWMTSFFFVQKASAEELLRAPGVTSFLLVTVQDDAVLDDILARLNDTPGVNALTKTEMSANDISLFAKVFSAPLKLMVGIAFLIGTLIVGIVTYTATVERQREYGVLRAIGASNRIFYKVVLTQAIFAALTGSLVGILSTYLTAELVMTIRPQFLITIDPSKSGWAVLTGLAMATAAAFFPARVISKLEPAEVFRK